MKKRAIGKEKETNIKLGPGQKIFVLDTSIFIDDPHAFEQIGEDNVVIVPIWVFEEFDSLKNRENGKGYNAREASRILSEAVQGGRPFLEGVPLGTSKKGKLYFRFFDPVRLKKFGLEQRNDNKIILCAQMLAQQYPELVVLISNDNNMRLKAESLGVRAEFLKSVRIDFSEKNFLIKETAMKDEEFQKLFLEKKEISLKDFGMKLAPHPNEIISIFNEKTPSSKIFCRWQKKKDGERYLLKQNIDVAEGKLGFSLKNEQQKIAVGLLYDDRISILALFGKTGGGKSLLASAYALNQIEKKYEKIIIYRTNHSLGKDLGALPGDLDEKFSVWAKPAIDCMIKAQSLLQNDRNKKKAEAHIEKLIKGKLLEINPIAFIRGGTIENSIIIIDEPQNMTRHEIKTLLTRKGEKSKMILTGDVTQIDNDYVDLHSNGFSHALHLLRGLDFFGYLQFLTSERSDEAEKIANLFEN